MEHEEKRENTRVVFHTSASVNFGGEVFEHLDMRDLSLRGLYVLGVKGYGVGEICDVCLFLSGAGQEQKLCMKGEVARVDSEGVGIHFSEIDIDTFSHLKNIVYYNADDPDQLEANIPEELPDGPFV